MAKNAYPKSWNDKYTDPKLRARLKKKVTKGDKGGKPGQWSARKAQLLKAKYEKAGGGYLGKKDASQQHLSQWTSEDWQTSSGSKRARTDAPDEKGGASKRYLPKKAWNELTAQEKRDTDAAKTKGSRQGRQFVPNPEPAAQAGAEARTSSRRSSLPIEDYASLTAVEAAKAVGRLEDRRQVRRIATYERNHANRKTVLQRIERILG